MIFYQIFVLTMLGMGDMFVYAPIGHVQGVSEWDCEQIALQLKRENPDNWYWCEERIIL